MLIEVGSWTQTFRPAEPMSGTLLGFRRWAWLYGADQGKDARRGEKGVGVSMEREPQKSERRESGRLSPTEAKGEKPSQEAWSAGSQAQRMPGTGGVLLSRALDQGQELPRAQV